MEKKAALPGGGPGFDAKIMISRISHLALRRRGPIAKSSVEAEEDSLSATVVKHKKAFCGLTMEKDLRPHEDVVAADLLSLEGEEKPEDLGEVTVIDTRMAFVKVSMIPMLLLYGGSF